MEPKNIVLNFGRRIAKLDEDALLEALSKLEHDQWMAWSKDIAKSEDINKERLKRWKKLWISYKNLSEEDKDKDREWGEKVIKIVKKYNKEGSTMRRIRLTKIASMVNALDKMADEIQQQDENLALTIDKLSDFVERKAYYPMGWLPGRGLGPGRGRGFGMGWMPGQRVTRPGPGPGGLLVCPGCGYKIKHTRNMPCALTACPQCGTSMTRQY